jgi:hypothetical protein
MGIHRAEENLAIARIVAEFGRPRDRGRNFTESAVSQDLLVGDEKGEPGSRALNAYFLDLRF